VLAASVAGNAPAWRALALRRWIRLCLPVLGVALIIYALQALGAFKGVPMAAALSKSAWLSQMFTPNDYTITLVQTVRSALFGIFSTNLSYGLVEDENGVLWTMPVEMWGSLALFAFYCFGADVLNSRKGRMFTIISAVILTFGTPFYGFGIGIALFESLRLFDGLSAPWQARLRKGAVPLGGVLLPIGCWLASTPYAVDANSSYHAVIMFFYATLGLPFGITPMHHAGAGMMIASVLLLRPLQSLLTTWPCRFLGRVSFMLYLLQLPVLCFIGVHVFMHGWLGREYLPRLFTSFAVYIIVALIVAELATRFIDRPAIRLSRKVTGWFAPKTNPAIVVRAG